MINNKTVDIFRDNCPYTLEELIGIIGEMNLDSGVSQSVYVIEECSELIKELTKKERGKGDDANIFDEACDVLTTVCVLLHQHGASVNDVKERMMFKCNQALERYRANGEA